MDEHGHPCSAVHSQAQQLPTTTTPTTSPSALSANGTAVGAPTTPRQLPSAAVPFSLMSALTTPSLRPDNTPADNGSFDDGPVRRNFNAGASSGLLLQLGSPFDAYTGNESVAEQPLRPPRATGHAPWNRPPDAADPLRLSASHHEHDHEHQREVPRNERHRQLPQNGLAIPATVHMVSPALYPGAFTPDMKPVTDESTFASEIPQAVVIGRGAFGVVHRVDVDSGNDCAHRVAVVARKSVPLTAGLGDTAGGANRAVRTELAVARRIHALAARRPEAARHLLRVHAVRVGQTEAAIDMELLDAGDLARFAPLPSDAHVAAVARQLLRGLRALHRDVRALHRDIKLQNALASRDGRVRLVDFGSAALAPDHHHHDGSTAPAAELTATDQQGTVLQMAPERLRGEPHGPASDVWGLGAMLAELATGAHPFVPADAARRLGSTERFWALAEVIRHTASPDECAAATDAAVAGALAGSSAGLRGFVGGMLRAAPGARLTIDELLAHPFLRQEPPLSDATDGDADAAFLAPVFSAAASKNSDGFVTAHPFRLQGPILTETKDSRLAEGFLCSAAIHPVAKRTATRR